MIIKNILKGIIIGIGSIAPGVSGGTFAMILGVYDKITDAIGNFYIDFKSKFMFLCSIGLGVGIGVIGFSNEPFTQFMELSISSVDQTPVLMGKISGNVFLESIKDNSSGISIEKKLVLAPTLYIRESSKRK